MEAHPPFLTVGCDFDAGFVEVGVAGRWSQRLGTETYHTLRKCLTEHPSAVIVDLDRFEDPYAASAAMWLAVSRAAAAMHPAVQLVLCVPPSRPLAGRLRRLGAAGFLPIFQTMAAARAAAEARTPLTDRLQLTRLAPEESSVLAAAELVDAACAAWDLPELRKPARWILTELVRNAITHAGTELAASVWRRGTGLHLSVRDADPRLPQPLEAGTNGHGGVETGSGLRVVEAKAAAWGAMATRDGKMVWATLRARPRRGHDGVSRPGSEAGHPLA